MKVSCAFLFSSPGPEPPNLECICKYILRAWINTSKQLTIPEWLRKRNWISRANTHEVSTSKAREPELSLSSTSIFYWSLYTQESAFIAYLRIKNQFKKFYSRSSRSSENPSRWAAHLPSEVILGKVPNSFLPRIFPISFCIFQIPQRILSHTLKVLVFGA